MHHHELVLHLSPAATNAVANLDDALVVELELLFSCLVRKRVKFPVRAPVGARLIHVANPKLAIHFRAVATRHCRLEEIEGEQETELLPLARPEAFTPRWLRLDYRNGQWSGDFGYATL